MRRRSDDDCITESRQVEEQSVLVELPPSRTPHTRVIPKYWVIYQGKSGEEHARHLRGMGTDLCCELVFTSTHAGNARKTVRSEVIRDCRSADAAIAIITPDQRHVSRCGNLWFELGLWLGSRNPDNLRVLQHVKTELISDLRGTITQRFETKEEFTAQFRKEVLQLNQHFVTSDGAAGKWWKVQAVFNAGHDACWLRPESYSCHRKRGIAKECDFRSAAMEFAAELLRMGSADHERRTLEDCFFRLAYAANDLWYESGGRNSGAVANFLVARDTLLFVSQRLFSTSGRVGDSVMLSGDEHIVLFLRDKLAVAVRRAILKQLLLPAWISHAYIANLREEIDVAWGWLKEFDTREFSRQLSDTRWDTAFRQRFNRGRNFFRDLGLILQALSWDYLDLCHKVLTDCATSDGDPRTIHDRFQQAMRRLPHNVRGSHLTIWRDPASGSSTAIDSMPDKRGYSQ